MSAGSKFRRVAGRAVLAVVAVAGCAVPVGAGLAATSTPAAAAKPPTGPYALALGSWLTTGIGASSSAATFVSQVAAHEAARYPGLQVENLGCGGATTTSFESGPGCAYSTGTQLGDAVAFLKAHPRQVAYVTVELGADDVTPCQTGSGQDPTCASNALSGVASRLPQELAALQAAGPGVPIYGMTYYDPFLASWLTGSAGQSAATQSVAGTDQLNAVLTQAYGSVGASTVDVTDPFATDDNNQTATWQGAAVPVDVANVCTMTDACTTPGAIQPDDAGYATLATAVEQAVDGVAVNRSGLPPASVKVPYSTTLSATGGMGPYHWSVVGGALPTGLRLKASTGTISGTPKTAGIAVVTVQATSAKTKVKPSAPASGSVTLSLQVLAAPEGMPASGLYATQQYATSQIHEYTVQFSSAPDADGVVSPLLMDIYVPPDAATAPRPTVILIHGGGFVGGSRTDADWDAQNYATYGYVGVTVDYRLVSVANAGYVNASANTTNATIDVQQAVRYLRANAAAYGVDGARIAPLGTSAGGAIALGLAVGATVPYTGPLSDQSPAVTASVSTGAFLTPGLPALTLTNAEAPSLLFMYAYDQASPVTAAYAFETCDALRAAGNACYEVEQAGTGHTTSLSAGGQWWTSQLGPFLWDQLKLSTAAH